MAMRVATSRRPNQDSSASPSEADMHDPQNDGDASHCFAPCIQTLLPKRSIASGSAHSSTKCTTLSSNGSRRPIGPNPPVMAQDRKPAQELRSAVKKLAGRRQRHFDDAAPKLAEYFVKASSHAAMLRCGQSRATAAALPSNSR